MDARQHVEKGDDDGDITEQRSNGATTQERNGNGGCVSRRRPPKIKDEAKKNGDQKRQHPRSGELKMRECVSAGRDASDRKTTGRRKVVSLAVRIAHPGVLRDQVAKYFSASPPKKGEATLRARCKPGLAGLRVPPVTLISWFLHVNFCRPISAVPEQPQRRPGAAYDLRAAPQGHPWASDLFLRCLFSTGVNGFPPLFLEREAAGCLPARTALIRGMASSACSARPLYHWRGPPFSWSPPAASVTKADAAMGIGEGEGRGGTLRRHACRSKRSAAA